MNIIQIDRTVVFIYVFFHDYEKYITRNQLLKSSMKCYDFFLIPELW